VQFHLRRYLSSFIFIVLLCFSVAVGATVGILFVYNSDLPQVDSLEDSRPSVIAVVYSDDNQVIGSFAQERRILVKWEDIPPVLRNAIISVEDQNFYEHWGIDLFGIARASLRNLMNGRIVEGGSTLTQQLSKNLFLTNGRSGVAEKTLGRKIQEAMLAIQIERTYTKEQILTMYCNLGYMGHGQYGFAAAAEFYFGKEHLKDLIQRQSAEGRLEPLRRLPVRHRREVRLLDLDQVTRIISRDRLVLACAEGREFLVDYTLQELEERLPPGSFLRVHRAALVNVEAIESYGGEEGVLVLRLKDGTRVEASERRAAEVRRRLK